MGATKVSDEQQASWDTELSHKSHKQDLERQETIPLKPKASPESETEEDNVPDPNDTEPYSKKKAAIYFASMIHFFGLFALSTWLALRHVYGPTYAIDDIQIRTLAMNATTVSADILYNITAHNKNRNVGFKYKWITIDASYSGWNFARSTIPGFKQGKRSNVTMQSPYYVQNFALRPDVATSLSGAIQSGRVPLRVFAKAKLHVTIGKYVSFPLNVNVDCRFLAVRVPVQSLTSIRAFNLLSKVCRLTRPRYRKAKKLKTYNPSKPIRGHRGL